jgi:hypothetical protein
MVLFAAATPLEWYPTKTKGPLLKNSEPFANLLPLTASRARRGAASGGDHLV